MEDLPHERRGAHALCRRCAGGGEGGAMKSVLVVAVAENNVIGRGGALPWHLKSELAHFKNLTTNHPVLMGRNTYVSIGKPLPNRTNIVLTRKAGEAAPGLIWAASLEEGLALARAGPGTRGGEPGKGVGGPRRL